MNNKLNCWDVKKCCNETGNKKICPVKQESIANGLNGGINGGRICWVIMDSHCKQKPEQPVFSVSFITKLRQKKDC